MKKILWDSIIDADCWRRWVVAKTTRWISELSDGEVGVDVINSFRDTGVYDGERVYDCGRDCDEERDCERERWNDGDKLRSYMSLKELFIFRLALAGFFFFSFVIYLEQK